MTSNDAKSASRSTQLLTHVKTQLALHKLRDGVGRPLLLLHGLGEQTPLTAPAATNSWPGSVHGLDFTGHGESTVPVGGGYTCELLMSDADRALAELGEVTILGRGLGGYIGLLLAGARPHLVVGAIIADGPGLAGGGSGPTSATIVAPPTSEPVAPDPWALVELARDTRPADYVIEFVHEANKKSRLDSPISVASVSEPDWLRAVSDDPFVRKRTTVQALADFARA
jgi:pimeloyl-ACP methyl ester carboxylesterase